MYQDFCSSISYVTNYTPKSGIITPHDDGRLYVELFVDGVLVRSANFATWRGADRVVQNHLKR